MRFFYKPTLIALLLFCATSFVMAQQDSTRSRFVTKLSKLKSDREKRILSYRQNNRARLRFTGDFLLVDVTPNGIPIYRAPLNANAAITAGVDKLHSGSLGISLYGKGMIVGVWDAGQVPEHIELDDRIIFHEPATVNAHAAHVTGTLMALGVNPAAKGMAPQAQATTWHYDDDYEEMFNEASSGLIISNHSYGSTTGWVRISNVWYWTGDSTYSVKEDYRFGLYGLEPQIIDEITSLSPYYTVVWAAGNDRWEVGDGTNPPDGNEGTGYDCIIPEAVAKNSIVVGAVDKVVNYTGPASVPMAFFSSWGPTDDGRIKPDLVADGLNIFSLTSSPPDGYAVSQGTSMAAPSVTGSIVLLQELYKKLHSNKVMRASTVKALAIHTAKESGTDPGPDYRFGWGLIDAEQAAKTLLQEDGVNVMVKEFELNSGGTIEIPLQPVPNKKITVTIAWTDPAGTPPPPSLDPTTPMLVNDIDIRLADEDSNQILPWILDPANPSAGATTGDNIRDNVEKIEFDLPEDRPYNLTISHKSVLQGSQYVSLIITHESKLTIGKTFYWVGGTGNWRDTVHWSLSTGGPVAMELPTASDVVMIDDNSFSGVAQDTIALDSIATCGVFKWLTNKSGVLSMNGDTLFISKGLTLASDSFATITPGTFIFNGIGEVNIQAGNIENDTLIFASGEWTVHGDLKASRIRVIDSELSLANTSLTVTQIIADNASTVDLTDASLSEAALLSFDGTILESEGTQIVVSGNSIFDFENIQYRGTIQALEDSHLTLFGDSEIDSLLVPYHGTVQIEGSNTINYLEAISGADIIFAADKTQHLSEVAFFGHDTLSVGLESTGLNNAKLDFADHKKVCFDYLNIADVDITGNAVVSAGANSVVSGGEGWLTVPCDEVLFPQFTVDYTCLHGLTEFTDTSTGDVTTWLWNFGDPSSADNTSSDAVAYHQFTGFGPYLITLEISNANQHQIYSRQIAILPNTLDDNSIIQGGHNLASLVNAPSYQWYLNDELIPGATNKTLRFEDPGSYTVLTSDGECNYLTDPFIILGAGDAAFRPYRVFPVPADGHIKVSFDAKERSHRISILDIMGQKIIELETNDDVAVIDVQKVKSGIYFIDSEGHKTKIIIRH